MESYASSDDDYVYESEEEYSYVKEASLASKEPAILKEHDSRSFAKKAEAASRLASYEAKFIGKGTSFGSMCIKRDFRTLAKEPLDGVTVEFVGDSLYKWHVYMDVAMDLPEFEGDCRRWGVTQIHLEITFPEDYPSSPPFVRVITPRFAMHTGHVTVGGSICAEVLTPSGWTAARTMADLIVDLQALIAAGGPRLDPTNQSPYSEAEARANFLRIARSKGWL